MSKNAEGHDNSDAGFDDEEVRRAWEYHNAADSLIHMRLQAFMASQAILLVPFMITVSVMRTSSVWPIQVLISITGIIMCSLAIKTMFPISEKLEFLKVEYLSKDVVYFRYLFGYKAKVEDRESLFEERRIRWNFKVIPIAGPLIFLIVWAVILFFVMSCTSIFPRTECLLIDV